ncbi:unnamed protein product [Orchesella dallaii]|uniref:Uncharacterized protein n=1 Tax=Orchesella dallaii TaxID=48710 RepID=A0ABP1RMW7_9HEXA
MAPVKNISDVSKEARPLRHCRKTNQVAICKKNVKNLWICACSKHSFKISPPPCHDKNQDEKWLNGNLTLISQQNLASASMSTTVPKPAAESSVLGSADKSINTP